MPEDSTESQPLRKVKQSEITSCRLAELARKHPEAFDPERLLTTSEALERVLGRVGRPPSPDPTIAVPTRLPRSMMQALDALLATRREQDPALTRQDLMREAVARHLRAEGRKAGRR
jgi:hypothetical protein